MTIPCYAKCKYTDSVSTYVYEGWREDVKFMFGTQAVIVLTGSQSSPFCKVTQRSWNLGGFRIWVGLWVAFPGEGLNLFCWGKGDSRGYLASRGADAGCSCSPTSIVFLLLAQHPPAPVHVSTVSLTHVFLIFTCN